MQVNQNGRRNFLSSIAILSAGVAFRPAITHFSSSDNEEKDLQKKWKTFWKKSGGRKFNTFADLIDKNNLSEIRGHVYKSGEVIYFPNENILASPAWIFWKHNSLNPSDTIVTLFEGNTLKKIARLNRFEIEALYKLSGECDNDNLLSAYCNGLKPADTASTPFVKHKICVTKSSGIQQSISYYRNQQIVLDKKFIYHS